MTNEQIYMAVSVICVIGVIAGIILLGWEEWKARRKSRKCEHYYKDGKPVVRCEERE